MRSATLDRIRRTEECGLQKPVFEQDDSFKIILYRPSTDQDNLVALNATTEIENLLKVLVGEMSRKELQEKLELKHSGNFRENYIDPALMGRALKKLLPFNLSYHKKDLQSKYKSSFAR